MVFSSASSAILTFFCVGLLGYLLRRRGWIGDETAKVLPAFLTAIVLPPFLLRNVTTTFEHDQLLEIISGCVIPFITICATYFVAAVAARLFRVKLPRRNAFKVMFTTSNTMNIGLPVCVALFGEVALPYVLLYFFAGVTTFWTYGNYLLAKDSPTHTVRIFSLANLKKIFSPPLLGFLCGLLLVLFDVRLPAFLDRAFKYVGDMTVPVAVIYIGVLLHDVKLTAMRFDRDIWLVILGRFIVAPLIVIGVTLIFPVPQLARDVYIVQSSLPVMMNAAILVGYYNADATYATVLVSATTLMALITVPAWAYILTNFL